MTKTEIDKICQIWGPIIINEMKDDAGVLTSDESENYTYDDKISTLKFLMSYNSLEYQLKYFVPDLFVQDFNEGKLDPKDLKYATNIGHPKILTFLIGQQLISCDDFLKTVFRSINYDYGIYLKSVDWQFKSTDLLNPYLKNYIKILYDDRNTLDEEIKDLFLKNLTGNDFEKL